MKKARLCAICIAFVMLATARVFADRQPPDITLSGHGGPVFDVAFSPDATRVASVGDDGKVKIWDVPGKKELFTIDGARSSSNHVRVMPDGTTAIVLGSENNLLAIDLQSGKSRSMALPAQAGGANSFDLSPDGKTIALTGRGSLILIDSASGAVKSQYEVHKGYEIPAVAFSADGSQIATASSDNTALIVGAAGGSIRHSFKLNLNGVAVAISHDGKVLYVSTSDRALQSFDVETGAAKTLVEPGQMIFTLVISTDGKSLVMGGLGHWPSLVSVPDGALIEPAFDSDNWVKCAAMSADGKWLVGGAHNGDVCLWKTAR